MSRTLRKVTYLLEQVETEVARKLLEIFVNFDEEVRNLKLELDNAERDACCAQDDLEHAESEIERLESELKEKSE